MADFIINLINLLITVLLSIWILIIRKKYPYNSIKYLIVSMFFFILDSIIPLLFDGQENLLEFSIFESLFSLIVIVWAFYFIVLFFETFYQTSPLNRFTLIFGFIAVSATVGGIVISMAIIITKDVLFTGINTLEGVETFNNLPPIARSLASIYLDIIVLSGVTIWCFMGYNIIQVTRRIRTDKFIDQKPKTKRLLYQLATGNVIMLLGSFFSVNESLLGAILIIIGYTLIYVRYLSEGVFILQANSLQRLIVLNPLGSPLYSYNFLKNQGANTIRNVDNDDSNEEILFSGALQATSMLLTHLTGSQQKLREITFEDIYLIIFFMPDTQASFILVTEQLTRFYREALENFAISLAQKVDLTQKDMMLGLSEVKISDKLVQGHFGL